MGNTTKPRAQGGAVLFIGLILLLLTSLAGLSALQDTQLQERLAGNLRDQELAFQAAEAALRAGERAVAGFDPALPGHYADAAPVDGRPRWRATATWSPAGSTAVGADTAREGLYAPPRYILELAAAAPAPPEAWHGTAADEPPAIRNRYRVTARANGASPRTVVILQALVME